jgi:serine/threonine protein kinase/tetratricopeptide (TPR) repeat protein
MNRLPPDAETIFADAIEIESPEERAGFLSRACQGNESLRNEVERLVGNYFSAGAFLERPAAQLQTIADPGPAQGPGSQIGPYRLVEQIGEGGFGVVYLAEQERPVRRRVALKIIKPGMDTRQVIARFEAERQALALMDHPNIAKVLDAGSTNDVGHAPPDGSSDRQSSQAQPAQPDLPSLSPDPCPLSPGSGRPYFVMELVHGVPITEYCDQCQLTTRERLELFTSVCDAVQHAHQKGVIHRDIKPTNVLVSIQDGKPAPKIIDFGVAKATGQRLTEHTLVTGFVQMIGTPMYMSPEQAELSQLGVDTRTDIYSLGVLLYELLTGTTPYEKERLHRAPFDEFRRIIREEEPPRPSWRLSTLAADMASTVAQRRHTEPQRLIGNIRGELDWIVMKCLEKERNRRYETASGLALDLKHYLNDEPVQACPPSARYRLHKFARRNRVAILTASLVAAALIVGTVASALWAVRAIEAEGLAEGRLKAELEAHRAADDARLRAEASFQKARQAVDDMYTQVAERWLSQQPQMQPLQREFLEKALQFYSEAAQRTGGDPAVRFETAMAHRRMGEIQHKLGQPAVSEEAFRQAVGGLQALANEFPGEMKYRSQLADSLHQFGVLLGDTGRYGDEEQAHRRALAIDQTLAGRFPTNNGYRGNLGRGHWFLGQVLMWTAPNRRPEAEDAFRSALAIQRKLVADSPAIHEYRHHLAQTYLRLGLTIGYLGRRDEERQALGEAAKLLEDLVEQSPSTPAYRNELANVYYWAALRQPADDARDSLQRAIALQEKLIADYPAVTDYQYDWARSQTRLGQVFLQSGDIQEAKDALLQAADTCAKLAADAPNVHYYRGNQAFVQVVLGDIYVKTGEPALALTAYEEAIALYKSLISEFPDMWEYGKQLGRAYAKLAPLLSAAGQQEEAATAMREAQRYKTEDAGRRKPVDDDAEAAQLDMDSELKRREP